LVRNLARVRYRAPKKVPVKMRSVLVELPEDKLLAVEVKAREAGWSVHHLAANILLEWLEAEK
jgi:hypothetical protein